MKRWLGTLRAVCKGEGYCALWHLGGAPSHDFPGAPDDLVFSPRSLPETFSPTLPV